ncbi:MAG: hypothetical protein IJX89_00680 [Alphaproteobacteria bacterium]|nr:hypothetical protein [Alphaproteobacteria bacterium]
MIKKILILFALLMPGVGWADILPNGTECATAAFANALANTAQAVSADDHETKIQSWIYNTFASPDTLRAVLACPEIAGAVDTDTIKFMPIKYTFSTGREIIVNYETQPKILKQRLTLAGKRTLPSGGDNPRIGAAGDDAIWTNTEPAWYAIMVTESGALDEFVGPQKNNTISLNYIRDNIDSLFPSGSGGNCTDRSAVSRNTTINDTVKRTVNIDDDSNDYYVAGDVNLQWISYLEIALDVVITVATMGGGLVISGATKSARAARVLKNLTTTIRDLSKIDAVRDYIKATSTASRLADEIKALDKVADATKIADKTRELERTRDTIRTLEANSDVKKYRDATKSFSELNQYRRALRGMRIARPAQRGNIVARLARAGRAAITGNKKIRAGAKVARSSQMSARVRDWLFDSTMHNIGMLGKLEATGGAIYGALNFIGGMYDWTETSTGEFTSGVDFAPLLLLSADDLQGQENVVNHGMWLMWAGDSVSVNDDDAAYLQAMDFAAKFHQDLSEAQNDTNSPCNVDIFVVRPVLRNPGTENPELYYLIMNDEPWTTNEN